MDAKGQRYTKTRRDKEETDEVENLVTRLAADLRTSIRRLDAYEVLSPQWLEMSEIFGRIATISDMESQLAVAAPKAHAAGAGTLWETEEQALRLILEDGKLNVCLRCMVEYKRHQRAQRGRPITEAPFSAAPPTYAVECDKFEHSLGTVLHNAWNHTEALQTTDLPALLNHVGDVLEAGLENGATWLLSLARTGELHKKQEGMAFLYILNMMKQLEYMNEERIMPIMRSKGLFMLLVSTLARIHESVPPPFLLQCIEALSLFVSTEDFKTYRAQYVKATDFDELNNFRTKCLAPLQAVDVANRLIMRPLIDCIDRLKRTVTKK